MKIEQKYFNVKLEFDKEKIDDWTANHFSDLKV